MKKHVILLADLDDEFASDLIDILRSAGMGVSSYEYSVGLEFHHELSLVESHDAVPIAIICQLSQQVHLTKVRDIVERARELWPQTPLVACPHHHFPRGFKANKQLTNAGFRAVAESPAQLPALLREVEDNPGTDEAPESFKP